MPQPLAIDIAWWITAVELPAVGGLFWLIWRGRREADQALDGLRDGLDAELSALRENLAAYKLEVAKSYASIGYLKDVERRLVGHLLRIEAKLDGQPLPGIPAE
ncbi:MAG TPA: hypothetical protein VEB20_23290 [Azospirillaceae bacterium]|nr:hypothetical protein [Azospirillaceae bacterium]